MIESEPFDTYGYDMSVIMYDRLTFLSDVSRPPPNHRPDECLAHQRRSLAGPALGVSPRP